MEALRTNPGTFPPRRAFVYGPAGMAAGKGLRVDLQAAAILDTSVLDAVSPMLAGSASEADLIARAKTDPEAFAILYRRHYRAVVGCLFRRIGDAHVAEDLAADTFIAAYRSIRRYRPTGAPFRYWLLRIATNCANRWSRRQTRAALVARAAGAMRSMNATQPDKGGMADGEHLHRVLRRLPSAQQSVISLHYFEGLTLEEAGVVLGCSVGTVKSRLSRGRDALRALLGEESRP
jgi:RNA polymerase sigma factor (sigma-70 family)